MGLPRHASKGFYRPIQVIESKYAETRDGRLTLCPFASLRTQLYVKGDFTPSQVRWSDTYHPQTPYDKTPFDSYRFGPINRPVWKQESMANAYSGLRGSRRDASYSSHINRFSTPSQYVAASTSQYYNPLETDSYLPSYDNEVQTRHYCFASPLYSTVWSPPASGRKSASQTPLFGSIRRVNDADDNYIATRRHVYPPTATFEGGSGSSRSVDDINCLSPQVNHVYATGSSVREVDLDTNANSPKEHVYATSTTPCCENSSSPRPGPPDNLTESPSHHYSGESSRSIEQDEHNIIEE